MPSRHAEPARAELPDPIEMRISLWEGLRGLSIALDLTMGRHGGHAQAVAALGIRVGRRLGLAERELAELGLAALLKDAGCPSTRAPFTSIVGLDDIAFHRYVFALEQYSPRSFAGLLWTLYQTQTDRISTRVVSWTRSLLGFKRYAEEFVGTARRQQEAARIAAQLDCPRATVAALAALGEHWDGSGNPGLLAGDAIPIASRILAACRLALIWAESASPQQVARRLGRVSGRFDPRVMGEVDAILHAAEAPTGAAWIEQLILECATLPIPPERARPLDALLLASTFAELVDVKSAFTASHSLRVASLAGAMASHDRGQFCFGATVSQVILAGLLHDLGKLAVPNTILDKQGPLTPEEWVIMRRHPADSARIIASIAPWREIAAWAGAHHERVDGRGYHQGLAGAAIPPVGRLLAAADAFDAMIADRPYRKGIDPEEALQRVRAGRGTQFDPVATELLEAVVNARGVATGPLQQIADRLDPHPQRIAR